MQEYEDGLFGCFKDPALCCYTFCCPVCQNAKNWAKVRNYECSWISCCAVVHPYWVRKEVLIANGLTESEVGDCCLATFCMPCTVCQDGRKLGTNDVTQLPTAPKV